jgi:hypothetical protein
MAMTGSDFGFRPPTLIRIGLIHIALIHIWTHRNSGRSYNRPT